MSHSPSWQNDAAQTWLNVENAFCAIILKMHHDYREYYNPEFIFCPHASGWIAFGLLLSQMKRPPGIGGATPYKNMQHGKQIAHKETNYLSFCSYRPQRCNKLFALKEIHPFCGVNVGNDGEIHNITQMLKITNLFHLYSIVFSFGKISRIVWMILLIRAVEKFTISFAFHFSITFFFSLCLLLRPNINSLIYFISTGRN